MPKILPRFQASVRRRVQQIQKRFRQYFQGSLSEILAHADPKTELGERVAWIESLLDWIRTPVLPEAHQRRPQHIQSVRVRFFLQLLERNPEWKEKVGRLIYSVLVETEPLNLFCLTGLSRQSGFFSEAWDRISRRNLPALRNERDLSELFNRIFSSEEDADWLENLDPAVLRDLYALLVPTQAQREVMSFHFYESLDDALTILTAQIEALGLSPEIRLRTGIRKVRESAFWKLQVMVRQIQEKKDLEASALLHQIRICRNEVESALVHLEEHGVSLAIVYRLEQIEWYLDRAEILTELRLGPSPEGKSKLWLRLLAELVRNSIENRQVGPLLSDNLRMLARKIVERSGDSGEHYITRTPQEYFKMWASAAGGGVLTLATTLFKVAIGALKAAPFVEGFLSWLNYSGSFLLMQALHLTLATKQPSMTAPALAAKLRALKSREQVQDFVDEIAHMTRSQFIAAVGNVGAVVPSAILADVVYFLMTGQHILSEEYAHKIVGSLNPLTSMTIPFAALTGVILWFSSLCAGWTENWFTYRQLPEALSQSSLARFLSKKNHLEWAPWLHRNISGIGGCLSLGFFLAYVPVLGRFFGLGVDVRHVTLSAGSLALALMASPAQLTEVDGIMAIGGIVVIGCLNFGVSFALALSVAVKARNVKQVWLSQLAQKTWVQMRRRPLSFFLPIRRAESKSSVL